MKKMYLETKQIKENKINPLSDIRKYPLMQYGLWVATINIINCQICYRDNLDTNQCLHRQDLWGYGQRSRDIFRTA